MNNRQSTEAMTDKQKQAMTGAVKLLKNIYSEDFIAVAQIIEAEAKENKELIADYIQCVSDYCHEIAKILKEK